MSSHHEKAGSERRTTTANIGIGLSQLGKKVIVIDTDLGLRNLDVVMGLENGLYIIWWMSSRELPLK